MEEQPDWTHDQAKQQQQLKVYGRKRAGDGDSDGDGDDAKPKPKKQLKIQSRKKSNSARDHPPYLEMITEAVLALKERTGSSREAIAKFLEAHYGDVLPENFRKNLWTQLKYQEGKGNLIRIKNSFKLSSPRKHASKATKTSRRVKRL